MESKNIWKDIGDICGENKCGGIIEDSNFDDQLSCSCHINPPCSKCCQEEAPYCPECDWEYEELEVKFNKPKITKAIDTTLFTKMTTFNDLKRGELDLIYVTIPGTYYFMTYHGYFPEGWSRSDVESKFNTCFSCKWIAFNEEKGEFKLKVYTD